MTATPADPHHDPRPWQDCTREGIREGDLAETRVRGLLRVGVAHHQDEHGDWYTEGGDQLTFGTVWPLRRIPAPTPPVEEVEWEPKFGDVITDVKAVEVRGWSYYFEDQLVYDGLSWCVDGDKCSTEHILECTLRDGTRIRRDGEREYGRPRFVKVQEGEK